MKVTKGIKAFKLMSDGTLETGGLGGSKKTVFQVGETYKVSGKPKLCENGFHFYEPKNTCFGINLFGDWPGNRTVLHEITAYGKVVSDTKRCVCCKIKIGKKIKIKVDGKYNSGKNNSGLHNSGNYNYGEYNSGNYNAGWCNSGDYNTGNDNLGNYNDGWDNSGHFNWYDHPNKFYCFDQPCSPETWGKAKLPKFLKFIPDWDLSYKEILQKAWKTATETDKKLLEKLPNFNWETFTKITGIEK